MFHLLFGVLVYVAVFIQYFDNELVGELFVYFYFNDYDYMVCLQIQVATTRACL